MHLRVPLALFIALGCVWYAPGRGVAQDVGDTPAEALELFQEAAEHYRRGRFSAAIELLQDAYEIHADPVLLYNLARAMESNGDLEGAVVTYEQYLAHENIPDRGRVRSLLASLRERLAKAEDWEEPSSSEDAHSDSSYRLPDEDLLEEDGGDEARLVPWVIAGIGGVALGAGVVVGAMAQSRHDEARSDPVHATAVEAEADANTLATLANVAFITGGLLVAGGLTWGIVELTGSEDSPEEGSMALGVGPGQLTLRGRF